MLGCDDESFVVNPMKNSTSYLASPIERRKVDK